MNRLNEQGLNLMAYKKEFKRDHTVIVTNALRLALNKLVNEGRLDLETLDVLQDETMTVQMFERYLVNHKGFIKDEQALFVEFEKIRLQVEQCLKHFQATTYLETESIVSENVIMFSQPFRLSQAFLVQYFGIDKNQYLQLTRKKGFIEKFAVLRLNKVCKEMRQELEQDPFISQKYSPVYFDKTAQEFYVRYQYLVNIDFMEQEKNQPLVIKRIIETNDKAIALFAEKVGFSHYPSLIDFSTYPSLEKHLQKPLKQVETETKEKLPSPQVLIESFVSEIATTTEVSPLSLDQKIDTDEDSVLGEQEAITSGETEELLSGQEEDLLEALHGDVLSEELEDDLLEALNEGIPNETIEDALLEEANQPHHESQEVVADNVRETYEKQEAPVLMDNEIASMGASLMGDTPPKKNPQPIRNLHEKGKGKHSKQIQQVSK